MLKEADNLRESCFTFNKYLLSVDPEGQFADCNSKLLNKSVPILDQVYACQYLECIPELQCNIESAI